MAAAVKAINAKIRAHPVLNYVCSTRECLPFPSTGPSLPRAMPAGHRRVPDDAERPPTYGALNRDEKLGPSGRCRASGGPSQGHWMASSQTKCHLPDRPTTTPATPPHRARDHQAMANPSSTLHRFLGPRLQLWHPHRSGHGHPEEPRPVRLFALTATNPLPATEPAPPALSHTPLPPSTSTTYAETQNSHANSPPLRTESPAP